MNKKMVVSNMATLVFVFYSVLLQKTPYFKTSLGCTHSGLAKTQRDWTAQTLIISIHSSEGRPCKLIHRYIYLYICVCMGIHTYV